MSSSGSMGSHAAGKKSTIIWTDGLRQKFLEAVEKLGMENAAPRKILEQMNVEGLTRDHVASYLQKYRILLKKLAAKNDGVQISSNPTLLESSMANDASWNNSSIMMPNQDQMNWPAYSGMQMHMTNPQTFNPSTASFPFSAPLNVSTTLSSELGHSRSLPNEGYFMQAMGNNHVEENNLSNDTTGMVQDVNSLTPSNFGFVPNPDDLVYDYGGCSSEVYPYNNVEAGLSSDVNMNNELATNWNQENGINIANPSTYSFVENSNGVGCNYSCPNEVGEMGSFYGSNSNDNMENDIALSEADMAWLLSVTANVPITENPPNQEVNGQNIQGVASFDPNKNEEASSFNQLQTLDEDLHSFDPTFNMDIDEQFMQEAIWSPGTLADNTTHQGLIFNPYVKDD